MHYIHTHTHTDTHTYIYIYIYEALRTVTWHIVNVCFNYEQKGYTEIFIQLSIFTTRGRRI